MSRVIPKIVKQANVWMHDGGSSIRIYFDDGTTQLLNYGIDEHGHMETMLSRLKELQDLKFLDLFEGSMWRYTRRSESESAGSPDAI